MRTNPMVKPQTSSGWAVTLTVISCVCLAVAIRLFLVQPSAWQSAWSSWQSPSSWPESQQPFGSKDPSYEGMDHPCCPTMGALLRR